MADRTHSHDTPTPAMSAETVPSEEFVLVPREPTREMKEAGARENQGMYPIAIYRAMIDAAPVPNPSPAAKGGDAVREAAQAVINSATNTYRKRNGQRGTIEGDDGEMAWIVPFDPFEELRAALSTPTEGPASQDTAQDTLRRIEAMLDGDQGDDDGMQIMPDYPEGAGLAEKVAACIHLLERRRDIIEASVSPDAEADEEAYAEGCGYTGQHFGNAYDDAVCIDGYLWDLDSCDEPGGGLRSGGEIRCPKCNASPTAEGPASQTEGMGGDAEAVAIPVGWFLVPEVATEDQMNAGLYQSSHDSDHASVMQSYMDMVRTPVDLPPPFVALTPPETAEAVPVASYQKNKVGSDTLFWWSLAVRDGMPNNGPLYAHPDPEAARLREELERRENDERHWRHLHGAAQNTVALQNVALDEASSRYHREVAARTLAERKLAEAVKALETARAAAASDPAPATDDRERLVEALREAAVPFVRHYADWMNKWPDDREVSVSPRHTYGEIRALRAALATEASR